MAEVPNWDEIMEMRHAIPSSLPREDFVIFKEFPKPERVLPRDLEVIDPDQILITSDRKCTLWSHGEYSYVYYDNPLTITAVLLGVRHVFTGVTDSIVINRPEQDFARFLTFKFTNYTVVPA